MDFVNRIAKTLLPEKDRPSHSSSLQKKAVLINSL